MAISALTFLAEDAGRIERFLSITGLRPGALREAAAGPGFLRGVLEYLVGNEPLLVEFAAEAGLDPGEIVRALERLEGPRPLREP
ncbi:MAG TPA: DUF3572 domain-containing protein [Roseiarcus sp.]|nr:DUF3572 domain-containing protein [Roseiarcus sp.]